MDDNEKETKKDNGSKTWIIVIIIVVIVLGLVGFLVYRAVYSLTILSSQGPWGLFGASKENKSVEERANDIIDRAKNEYNSQVADMFNDDYERLMGTRTGDEVYKLLDLVIINNKKNSDKMIMVAFKDKATTNPEEIKELKRSLPKEKEYEVSLDYDDQDYVNKVTIEE